MNDDHNSGDWLDQAMAEMDSRRAQAQHTDFRPMRIADTGQRMRALYVSDQQADNSDVTPLMVRRSRIAQLTWLLGMGFALIAATIVGRVL